MSRAVWVSVVVCGGCALTGLLVFRAIAQRTPGFNNRRDPMGSVVSYIRRLLLCQRKTETKSLKNSDSLEQLNSSSPEAKLTPNGKCDGPIVSNGSAPKATESKVTILTWKGPAEKVQVTGSFTDWKSPLALKKQTDTFTTGVHLEPGRHEFKFIVDGEWLCSSDYALCDNGMGDQNNVIDVRQA